MSIHLIGVLSAITAGIAFNLGLVLQKVAVARVPKETSHLMRHVVRSPLWLMGFGIQFLFGTPSTCSPWGISDLPSYRG